MAATVPEWTNERSSVNLIALQGARRGSGVAVNPARVKQARLSAGLTMAQLGGSNVSRTFIHQVETGKSRPSRPVLRLIAHRTGKPLSYFLAVSSDKQLSKVSIAEELSRLSARVGRLGDKSELDRTSRQAVRLVETSLRLGAILIRNL